MAAQLGQDASRGEAYRRPLTPDVGSVPVPVTSAEYAPDRQRACVGFGVGCGVGRLGGVGGVGGIGVGSADDLYAV